MTLSAFCPTAASLLFEPGPFEIIEVTDARTYEGMDARDALPPILREGMLMDWPAVAAWESFAVRTLSDHRNDVDRAVEIIRAASEAVCRNWTPNSEPVATALASAYANADASGATALKGRSGDRSLAPPHPAGAEEASAFAGARAARERDSEALARFIAAHSFANWPMYQGRGIRGALDWLVKVRTALDEERRSHPDDLREAFRQADLRLRHSISPP